MPDSEAAEKFPNRAGPFVFLNDKKKKRKQMPPPRAIANWLT